MEPRGPAQHAGRPAIARRSCDHCRTRKIACDRTSPCPNCVNARIDCTYSAVAPRPREPRQRVLVSTQYERKIDDIAAGITGLWQLIQGSSLAVDAGQPGSVPRLSPSAVACVSAQAESDSALHSHFFPLASREDGLDVPDQHPDKLMASLCHIFRLQNQDTLNQNDIFGEEDCCPPGTTRGMPPLEAVVCVLRWAKEHPSYYMVLWLAQILPIARITQICQKVYFAVDDYTQVDLVLASGCLAWLFSEYAIVTGQTQYREYARQSSWNLGPAINRLTFLLPASTEAIAALMVGALHAIQISRVTVAWMLMSAASSMCQTLGYHRASSSVREDPATREAKTRLFWVVFRADKALSLRLGRPSTIQEWDVPMPNDPMEKCWVRTASLQGRVYAELYSLSGLSRSTEERAEAARALATGMEELMSEAFTEAQNSDKGDAAAEGDKMRRVYVGAERVVQLSVATLIHRATAPLSERSATSLSNDCVRAAHGALEEHHRCVEALRACTEDPTALTKYIHWTILYAPFLPFVISFARALEAWDSSEEMSRIDRFAASIQPPPASSPTSHRFQRFFRMLYDAGRLLLESRASSTMKPNQAGDDEGGGHPETGMNGLEDELGWCDLEQHQQSDLDGWYHGEDMMGFLDEDALLDRDDGGV